MNTRNNPTKQAYLREISERNSFIKNLSIRIAFNFKFFQFGDKGRQSFDEWEREKILADLNNKIKDYSCKTILELHQDKTLEIYTAYPKESEFKQPETLAHMQVKWARLRITGHRRLIGFFTKTDELQDIETKNVFYVVFLDNNHDFAPTTKQ